MKKHIDLLIEEGYIEQVNPKGKPIFLKLSEEGITTYADKLLTEHETLIAKAQEMYLDLKVEGIEKAKELQVDTEKNILINEKKIKSQLDNAGPTYKAKESTIAQKLGAFMTSVMSHLSWKKDKIEEQRSNMFDE